MSTTTIDQQFVEYIVKSLVGNPDAVTIERRIDEKGVLLELTVDPEDLGRVIGKRGATAQSLRTLLRALGTKNDARYNLKIIDVTGGQYVPANESGQAAASDDDAASSVADAKEDEEATEVETEEESSVASKTRRELAELDDLDI